MKCPHCGQFIENSLFKALRPYRNGNAVVVTNVDYVIDVGSRIRAIIEEKHGKSKLVRGYQLVTLKKIAKSLRVPLYVLFSNGKIELYEVDRFSLIRSNPFVSFAEQEPILSGSIKDLGNWIYEKFLSDAPPSKKVRRGGVVVKR